MNQYSKPPISFPFSMTIKLTKQSVTDSTNHFQNSNVLNNNGRTVVILLFFYAFETNQQQSSNVSTTLGQFLLRKWLNELRALCLIVVCVFVFVCLCLCVCVFASLLTDSQHLLTHIHTLCRLIIKTHQYDTFPVLYSTIIGD